MEPNREQPGAAGKGDPKLLEKFKDELPGIFKLAINALGDLRRRGRFIQPRSVQDAIDELADLASPISLPNWQLNCDC